MKITTKELKHIIKEAVKEEVSKNKSDSNYADEFLEFSNDLDNVKKITAERDKVWSQLGKLRDDHPKWEEVFQKYQALDGKTREALDAFYMKHKLSPKHAKDFLDK
jgi:hypothetical protein